MSVRRGGLFVGSLEAEAGAVVLPEAGAAVLFEALDLYPGATVDIAPVGLSGAELRRRLQRCAFLLLPGLSYVAEPQALVMAFAEAVPVIASRLAVFDELVEP